MATEAKWSDLASTDATRTLAAANQLLPPWVALLLVVAVGWQLAKIVWTLVPGPAAGDAIIAPAGQVLPGPSGPATADVQGIAATHLFGEASCPHCVRAKGYLEGAGIDHAYHDVVREPRALYEMLARVKPIVGPKTPITVPQIWLDGAYVGGADQLSELLHRQVERGLVARGQ